MMRRLGSVILLAGLLAGCARHSAQIAAVPAPARVVAAPMPAGASPGMTIPAMLSDGSYQTPNRAVSTAAAIWHVRAGLNVAALACDASLAPRYNAMLRARKAALTAAEATVSREFRASGGDWQQRYDSDMTRLYNYFALSPARPGLCAAADRVLTELEALPADGLSGFAPAALAELDRPFTDFYRAYDAWRGNAQMPGATVATLAVVSPGQSPRIGVDPDVFRRP
jgi:hypothetical protein